MAAVNAVVLAGRAYAAKQVRQKGFGVALKGVKGIPKPGTKFKSLSNVRNKEDPATAALTKSLTSAFKKAMAPEPKPPPSLMDKLGGHMKQMQETVGALGIHETLRSFGDATIGAAADLESSRIGLDFMTSKLKGAGGKGKGKGPADAKALEQSFADYWTALRDNAQTTAFSASDVLSGGMKAIKLTKGDTKQAMQLVKLAEDMAAFNPGKSVKEAMEAIAAAKTHDYKKMKDFGLEFKKGSWNSFLKTADAWFKGGGEKLNTSANGMWEIITEGLKGSLQNAGVAALDQIKPVMLRLVNWLNGGGFKKLESLAAKTVDVFVKTFLWMADVLGPVFGWLEKALDWVGANFETLRPILNGLIAAFAAFAVISTAMSIISGIGTAVALLSNPIFWIVAAIGLLTAAWTGNWLGIRDKTAAAIDWLSSSFRSLMQFLRDLGAWMKQLWSDAIQALQPVITAFEKVRATVVGILTDLFQVYAAVWSGMANVATSAGSFIAGTVTSAFRTVSAIVSDAFDTILEIGRAGMELLRGLFVGVWKGAAGDHAGAVQTIRQAASAAFGKIDGLLSGFASRAKVYADQFVQGYDSSFGSLQRMFDSSLDAVKQAWDRLSANTSAARDAFFAYAADVGLAIYTVLANATDAAGKYLEAAWDRAFAAAKAKLQALGTWLGEVFDAIGARIVSALQSIGNFSSLLWGIVIGAFFWGTRIVSDAINGFIATAMSFGERFMTNLIAGIENLKGALFQKVYGIWDAVAGIFGGAAANMSLTAPQVPDGDRTGGGQLSPEQRSSMLQPYGAGGPAAVNQTKSVEVSSLVGEMHIYGEADEDRFIAKLKRMLEEDLLTEGEGVYAG